MVQVSTASPGLRSASDPVRAAPSGTVQRSHKPGEDHGRAVAEAEQPGLAAAAPALPLVEAVGRDQAAPVPVRPSGRTVSPPPVSERALMSLWPMAGSLAQAGNQPPPQHGERAPDACPGLRSGVGGAHDRDVLARRDVVSGPQVERCADEVEQLVQLLPGETVGEAATHRNTITRTGVRLSCYSSIVLEAGSAARTTTTARSPGATCYSPSTWRCARRSACGRRSACRATMTDSNQ